MKTPDEIVNQVEVEVTRSMQSICESLGLTPQGFFERIQADLTGASGTGGQDQSMLAQLYAAQLVSQIKCIDRGKVEDFLAQVTMLSKQLLRYEFEFGETSEAAQAITAHCKSFQDRNDETNRELNAE